MSLNAAETKQALTLLQKLAEVERWVREGNTKARPYLDADAARLVGNRVQFHRERFLDVYANELIDQGMQGVDNIITITKEVLKRGREL